MGADNFSIFPSLATIFFLFFPLLGVFLWNCGRDSRPSPSHFPFVKTAHLPRGSLPQGQSLRGERAEASSIPPAHPFFAPASTSPHGAPCGRDLH